jgi:hypothetical protein
VHGLGGLCQQVGIFCREPGRPWLGVFVGAEQNVDFARRLRRIALFRRCDAEVLKVFVQQAFHNNPALVRIIELISKAAGGS